MFENGFPVNFDYVYEELKSNNNGARIFDYPNFYHILKNAIMSSVPCTDTCTISFSEGAVSIDYSGDYPQARNGQYHVGFWDAGRCVLEVEKDEYDLVVSDKKVSIYGDLSSIDSDDVSYSSVAHKYKNGECVCSSEFSRSDRIPKGTTAKGMLEFSDNNSRQYFDCRAKGGIFIGSPAFNYCIKCSTKTANITSEFPGVVEIRSCELSPKKMGSSSREVIEKESYAPRLNSSSGMLKYDSPFAVYGVLPAEHQQTDGITGLKSKTRGWFDGRGAIITDSKLRDLMYGANEVYFKSVESGRAK